MIALRRGAFELQQGEAGEAPDPLDAGRPALDLLVLVAAGEYDLPGFRAGSLAAALRAPRELIAGVGDMAPRDDPGAFRSLLRLLA